MALQKWAAPAGSPLLATLTTTGPNTDGQFYSVSFASDGDIAVGTQLKIHVAGLLTTTGSPTMFFGVGGFVSAGGVEHIAAASSGVTDQPWTIDGSFTYRSDSVAAYDVTVTGLLASTLRLVGTYDPAGANWYAGVGWDVGASDADAGDIITMITADALWIG